MSNIVGRKEGVDKLVSIASVIVIAGIVIIIIIVIIALKLFSISTTVSIIFKILGSLPRTITIPVIISSTLSNNPCIHINVKKNAGVIG
eukprot:Awhi_evm3s13775